MIRKDKGNSLFVFPKEYIVFDIETTGLDPLVDEIIEIGAIKVKDNTVIEEFHSLIKPSYKIDAFITGLTGITNDMVEEAPSSKKVLEKFVKFIENNILVGHNVHFDINFIYDHLIKINGTPLKNDFVDTLRVARKILPELKHHRLKDLASYYHIDTEGNHRAKKDAEITFSIYQKLEETMKEKYGSVEIFTNTIKKSHSYQQATSSIIPTVTEFNQENLFYNQYVAITGTLEKMTRKEAMQIIVNLGGHLENTVTTKTNYLILGNNDYNPILRGKKSSKLIKAENFKLKGLEIEIISENVFYDLLSNNELEDVKVGQK